MLQLSSQLKKHSSVKSFRESDSEYIDAVSGVLNIQLALSLLLFLLFACANHKEASASEHSDQTQAHGHVEHTDFLLDLIFIHASCQEHVVVGLHDGQDGKEDDA